MSHLYPRYASHRNHCNHRLLQPAGFTLLEVLLVLAIMAALAAVLLPQIMSGRDHYQLTRNVRDVASAMRMTRALAIKAQADKTIQFNMDNKTFQVDGEKTREIDEEIDLKVLTAESEISEDGSRAGIRFYADGAATGGRVTLTLADDSRAIDVVWMTGQINILDNPDNQ